MMKENLGNTVEYASRRCHQNKFRRAIDDVESFFYSMCHVLRVPFPWFDSSLLEKDLTESKEIIGRFKFQTNKIRVNINTILIDRYPGYPFQIILYLFGVFFLTGMYRCVHN